MSQRPASRRRRREDAGETLIELLVTIAIMAAAVTAILGATATSIHLSDVHRKQAKAGSYVRAYAEALETFVAKTPTTGYKSCALINDYKGSTIAYSTGDASYTPTATTIKVWNPAAIPPRWDPSVAGCTDVGVQKATLQVQYSKAGQVVTESLDVIIRRPCRTGDTESQCA
jgi:type II secretory pathway pseudopilin PulG